MGLRESAGEIMAMLRDWRKYRRPLIALLVPEATGPRVAGGGGDSNGVVADTITAAKGLVDGIGSVWPLVDDGTGTRTMKYKLDKDGARVVVKVRNPFQGDDIQPGTGGGIIRCTYGNIGGHLKLKEVDCPMSGASGTS